MNKDLKINVSVAMATYNGEKYIEEQIDSILENLKPNDELVISDDGSTDKTLDIIKKYQIKDERIRFIKGPGKGVKQNFANAILNTKGKYIFLSDQDDIWMKDKVKNVINTFKKYGSTLVVHDAQVFDSENKKILYQSFFEYRNSGSGIIKNIYKNTYIGCCMAFDSKIKEKILPIPDDIEMHDQWIGIINDLYYNKSTFLKDKLIKYRRHLNNVSSLEKHNFYNMINNRVRLIFEILKKKGKETL